MTDTTGASTGAAAVREDLERVDALRRAGDRAGTLAAARAAADRHPRVPAVHDALARACADTGDLSGAAAAWAAALSLDPGHGPSHKGLGWLHFRAGQPERARRHLEAAAALVPGDVGVQAALARLGPREVAAPPPVSFEAAAADGAILFEQSGLRLTGAPRGADRFAADAIAARLAPVAREAVRTCRLLGLGDWAGLGIEAGAATLHVSPVRPAALLALVRPPEQPVARVAAQAARLAPVAARWLQEAG